MPNDPFHSTLHAAISLCLFAGYDVDETLSKTTKKFDARLKALRGIMKEHGLETLQGQSIELMLTLWDQAKQRRAS
jgi:uncharacterized protein YabN with tetrapyrrole methylase and pyrophosphatase domain